MSYKKFDEANRKVDASSKKMYGAFPWEAMRRALQGITNCVLQGTAGTGAFLTAGCSGGSTTGGQITTPIDVCIDGIKYAIAAQNNIPMPLWDGTQGTNTVAKYLFYAGTDGTALIAGPGNIVDKGLYVAVADAYAAAKLPDLPDNCVALGELRLTTTATGAVTTPRVGTVSTMGTAVYTDFIHMPMDR